MTLTNNHAQATIKQNNTNTEYLRGRSVFVFIVNKVSPFENHFINSSFMFHQDFQTLENKKKHSAFGLELSSAFSCLETLMKHSPSLMKYCIFTVWKVS